MDQRQGDPASQSVLHLYVLGGFRAERDGQPVPDSMWHRRSARQLVKLLALQPEHALHREQILDALWPGSTPKSALNSFRQSLHAARRVVDAGQPPADSLIRMQDELVGLDTRRVWVDAAAFELAAEEALKGHDIPAYIAALALYTGTPLPEERYEEWAQSRRAQLEQRYLDLLTHLSRILEQKGEYDAAIERARSIIALDPVREEAHRQLMRLYVLSGSRHQALRQFQTCREILRDELGVEPERETVDLHATIAAGGLEEESTRPRRQRPLPRGIRERNTIQFVGRERVFGALTDTLAKAQRGHGDFILIGGEAGVGKSRLASELARAAHDSGWLVLWGAAYEHEGPLAYAPFVEALDSYVSTLPSAERRRLRDWYPETSMLLPGLTPDREFVPAGIEAFAPSGYRAALFASVGRVLTEFARHHPVLLVLDDLHAADAESLQLLHHLARMAPERRWFIVGTYREEDATQGSEFHTLGASLTRQSLCRRIDLMRLSRADSATLIDALLGEPASPAVHERLYALSLGNPLFIHEMVGSWRERGLLASGASGGFEIAPVPSQVRDLLESRMQHMDRHPQQVLHAVAAAPPIVSFSLLRDICALDETLLLDALDIVLRARLLEERNEGYSFRHPLLRAAVYETLSRNRRIYLHGRIAAALERQMGDDGDSEFVNYLAQQFVRADQPARAVPYLLQAAERAQASLAHAAAARTYRQALELAAHLPGEDRERTEARIWERMGSTLLPLARYPESLAAMKKSLDMYRKLGAQIDAARVKIGMGHVYALQGLAAEGIECLRPVVESDDVLARPELAGSAFVVLAHLHFVAGNYIGSFQSAEVASVLARTHDLPAILASADQWRGTTLSMLGKVEEGAAVLRGVLPVAEKVNDLLNLSRALNGLAEIAKAGGRLEESGEYCRRGLEVAHRLGDPSRIAYMTARWANNAFLRGDWTAARLARNEALALLDAHDRSWVATYVHIAAGRLYEAEGDDTAADIHLERALEMATETGDVQGMRSAQAELAERDLMQGHAREALNRLEPLLWRPEQEADEPTFLLPLLARIYIALDRVDDARAAVARAEQQAQAENDRISMVEVWRARAQLADSPAERILDLQRAREELHVMPLPWREAQVLAALCLALQAEGRQAEARSAEMEARHIVRRLGARADFFGLGAVNERAPAKIE